MPKTGNRRRTRKIRPDVMRAIHEGLLEHSSPAQVRSDLLGRRRLPEAVVPSVRTISDIAREMRGDDSGVWRLEDTDALSAKLMMRMLNAIVRGTEGRITSFTRREAQLLPVVFRAGRPRYSYWQSYIWTRFYLSWVRNEQDAQDVLLALAAPPENSLDITSGTGNDKHVIHKRGSWPLTLQARLHRVFDALATWQEVERWPSND
jgi:hypothetical protein